MEEVTRQIIAGQQKEIRMLKIRIRELEEELEEYR